MARSIFVLVLLLCFSALHAQDSIFQNFTNRIGLAAGSVSGFGFMIEKDMIGPISISHVIGGVATKEQTDFNTGVNLKYHFAFVRKKIRLYAIGGMGYLYKRDFTYDWDPVTQTGGDRERRRSYLRFGAGLGVTVLLFDNRVGLDMNVILSGASYRKIRGVTGYELGNKPIRTPQIGLTYNF